MNELFTPDGHLTDAALKGLISGGLDELGRLEAGEHLSFCDRCLDRYTALLTEEVLESPETDLTLPVMRKNSTQARRQRVRRWASAAAAVAVGSTLFYTGVFQQTAQALERPLPQAERPGLSQAQAAGPQKPGLGDAILKAVDEWSIRVQEKAAPIYRAPNRPAQIENNEIGG